MPAFESSSSKELSPYTSSVETCKKRFTVPANLLAQCVVPNMLFLVNSNELPKSYQRILRRKVHNGVYFLALEDMIQQVDGANVPLDELDGSRCLTMFKFSNWHSSQACRVK